MLTKIKLGISSCLLGEKVRFDSGHKLDRFITDTLGKYVEFVPVCPEAECGLGIPQHYQTLGKLVAQMKELPLAKIYEQYQSLLMEALRLKATCKKNVNVLLHVMGYFKKNLSSAEKEELLQIINNYRQGYILLIVPITLLQRP